MFTRNIPEYTGSQWWYLKGNALSGRCHLLLLTSPSSMLRASRAGWHLRKRSLPFAFYNQYPNRSERENADRMWELSERCSCVSFLTSPISWSGAVLWLGLGLTGLGSNFHSGANENNMLKCRSYCPYFHQA